MSPCPVCGAPLETPVACAACGAVHPVDAQASPFEILGLPESYALDEREVRRRATRAARLVHPDYFAAAAPEVRALAERNSALVNRATETLLDPWQRADWIVARRGGPREGEARAVPSAFLAEVLEWNEILAEARAANVDDPRVQALAGELRRRRASALAALARALDPGNEPGSPHLLGARRELDLLRYVDRALREVEALRLARAERR